jgi:hypothetical protein
MLHVILKEVKKSSKNISCRKIIKIVKKLKSIKNMRGPKLGGGDSLGVWG